MSRNKKSNNSTDLSIKAFVKSTSYKNAGDRAELLMKYNHFSKEQLDEIVRGSINNRQIYEPQETESFLKYLIKKYSNVIDKEMIKKLKQLIKT